MVNVPIVSDLRSVCLVGGAATSESLISQINQRVDAVVAVDGGADTVHHMGLTPLAVIGDLDSISAASRKSYADILWHLQEQSTTDFEKALTHIQAPLIVATGFTGGRLDHQLSVLNVMLRLAERNIYLVDDTDVSFFAAAGMHSFVLEQGCRISLMPVAPATVSLSGVVWPFNDQLMAMAGFTSPSNEALGGAVTLQTDAPVLVTLPGHCLPLFLPDAARGQ